MNVLPASNPAEINILLVEDREDDYTYLSFLLQRRARLKYRLVWVKDDAAGLAALQEQAFDVCLCDYKLGSGNGIDFIREAQQREITCPIILLTGWDDPDIDYNASTVGAADYISKSSLDIARLEKSIRYARRHAQMTDTIRQTKKHLDLFLKHMPCAMAMKSPDGKYLYANEAMSRLLHHEQLEILGKADAELLDKENARLSLLTEQAVIASSRPEQMIQRVKTGDQERVWLASKFVIPERDAGPMLGVAAIDITDRVRTEERLRETHQLLATILETLPVIAGRIDEIGNILEIAGSGLRRFGLRPEELLGRSIHVLPLINERQVRRALAGRPEEFAVDGLDDAGAWNYIVRLMFDGQRGRGAIFFAQDQTECRRLEKQLLEINDHRQEAIGRDLHDGLGQHLTGISCLATVLRDKLQKADLPEAEQAGFIATLVQDAIEQTRALSRGLCPVQLEKDGLKAALEDLVATTAQIHQIQCRLEAEVPPSFADHSVAVHLYRITQEAVNNALRHGRAQSIQIKVNWQERAGHLTISDDGCGFNEGEFDSFGLGLHMMQFRANLIGATFSIKSQVGQGTQVSCTVHVVDGTPVKSTPK